MEYEERIKNNIINIGNSYGADMDIIENNTQHETILYRGCTSHFRENELIDNVCSCMDKKGIDYGILDDETCCGVMLFILGLEDSGREVIDANIKKFHKHGVKKIITICPGCYESFTKYYSSHPEFDIEVVLAMDLFNNDNIDGTGHIIHDPCHALDRREQVRNIIKNVPNKRANNCCGFGAGIEAGSKEVTINIAKKTLSGKKVITYCPACYHTLNRVNSEKTVDLFELINKQI